nr:MAG TPA: hypothetical protein [Caudoviricetes sp.]
MFSPRSRSAAKTQNSPAKSRMHSSTCTTWAYVGFSKFSAIRLRASAAIRYSSVPNHLSSMSFTSFFKHFNLHSLLECDKINKKRR